MNLDGTTTLLAAGAAALFMAGGMVLWWAREPAEAPAGAAQRAPEHPTSLPPPESPPREPFSSSALNVTRPPSADEERTSETILRVEVEHAATRDLLAKSEIELAETKAAMARLGEDLDTKQSVMQQMGAWLDEERVKLKTAQEQIDALKAEHAQLETLKLETDKEHVGLAAGGLGPRIPRPESMRPPDAGAFATLRGEVAEMRKKLEQSSRERETAEAKVKALETLVEAVRARSRELAQQVATFEQKAGK